MNYVPTIQCPKIVWGAKDGDHLNLDAIRVPGSPSVEELLRKHESPVTVRPMVRLERMLATLMGIYESAAETRDPEVKSELLRAALHKAALILEVLREIENDRHEAAIRDINQELDELKTLIALV